MRQSSSPAGLPRPHPGSSILEGQPVWTGSRQGARFLFSGRAAGDGSFRVPAHPRLQVAHLHQVHGVDLVEASPGRCGEGDALLTKEKNLALCIQTADCVPVLLVSDHGVIAIHAGWRGIAAGIIGSTLEATGSRRRYRAVIGPSIGPCCYEVDRDVADAVEAAVPTGRPIDRSTHSKPHLDLQLAVVDQLLATGTETVEWVRTCTRCSDQLYSFRRDGPGGGRNLAFVWRDGGT